MYQAGTSPQRENLGKDIPAWDGPPNRKQHVVKIVTLSTYPYSQPFHGGQRRLDAIARILRAAGHEVFALPLFFPGQYSRHDATEAITGLHDTLRAEMLSAGLREDLHLPSLLQAGVPAFDAARHRLFEIRPDILHVEQPWLFPLVDRLLEVLPDAPRISVVYGSQNVESDLMPERFRDEARAIEQAAVRRRRPCRRGQCRRRPGSDGDARPGTGDPGGAGAQRLLAAGPEQQPATTRRGRLPADRWAVPMLPTLKATGT